MANMATEEVPIGGFTQGELQMASWWVRNHLMLRKLGYGTLIGLAVLLWGYSLWGVLDAYAISYPRESRITHDIAVNQQLLAALEQDMPQGISLSDVTVLQTTDNRFDMEVEATNPNGQWWAEFDYRFNLSGEETPLRRGYVLPGSSEHLTELGYKPETRGGKSAALEVENMHWHRLDRTMVPGDYQDFAAQRLKLNFNNISYLPDIELGTKKVGETNFELENAGAYGFWGVDLFIRLYRGTSVIGLQQIRATNLSPGEKRDMQVIWPESPPGVTKTEIIPQVNLLDPSVFLPTEYFK